MEDNNTLNESSFSEDGIPEDELLEFNSISLVDGLKIGMERGRLFSVDKTLSEIKMRRH